MLNDFEINCVSKPDRDSSHEHITHIGNAKGGWRITREEAIYRIESGTSTFYTIDKSTGKRVDIGVVRVAGKAPYLRSHVDGKWNDNQLAQAECGSECRTLGGLVGS